MSFDTLAPYYRSMEIISAGGILQRCRTAFLAEAASCRRALLLGEGPGRFLVELLRTNPDVEVTCVESSPLMIKEALRAMKRNGLDGTRVTFKQMNTLTWQPPRAVFDLVATNFFLDCFRRDELETLVAKVTASTTDDAQWLLADFRVPERGWQRWRARMVLAVMYGFFRCVTDLSTSRLTPPDGLLEAAGFRLARRRLENCGLVHADLWRRTQS